MSFQFSPAWQTTHFDASVAPFPALPYVNHCAPLQAIRTQSHKTAQICGDEVQCILFPSVTVLLVYRFQLASASVSHSFLHRLILLTLTSKSRRLVQSVCIASQAFPGCNPNFGFAQQALQPIYVPL